MNKKITMSLVCIALCLATIFCLCSCEQEFKYDWTALDAYMEEHGEINTNLAQFIHGSGDVKTTVVHHEKDDDTKNVIQLVKLQEKESVRYYLQFEVLYYNLITDKTVKLEFVWFLPYDASDNYRENYIHVEFACYKTGYESQEEYWKSLDKVGVFINNLQLDNDGQFVGCEYTFQPLYAFDKHDYYEEIELEQSYDYYFNEMLTKNFNITTEFLTANNIPSFYDFSKSMPEVIVITPSFTS